MITLLFAVALAGHPDAEAQIRGWLEGLGAEGYRAEVRTDGPGFAPYCHFNGSIDCAEDLAAHLFIFTDEERSLTLVFSEPLSPAMSLDDVRTRFQSIALDRLPTPGLKRDGWRFSPRTPVSSFSEGVEVTAYTGERIQLTVDTRFYAVSGDRGGDDCSPPADGSMPEHCYAQVRQKLRGRIAVNLPMFSTP
ncbi:MAG: hypothetical protein KC912_22900 [Proteobacteria bacterium]|nr:hypothetical protein [Pseudomonadota bacterium]